MHFFDTLLFFVFSLKDVSNHLTMTPKLHFLEPLTLFWLCVKLKTYSRTRIEIPFFFAFFGGGKSA